MAVKRFNAVAVVDNYIVAVARRAPPGLGYGARSARNNKRA